MFHTHSLFLIQFVATYIFFFIHDTATPDIYTLSLHDALPISKTKHPGQNDVLAHRRQGIHNDGADMGATVQPAGAKRAAARTEKHIRALLRPGRAAVGGFQDAGDVVAVTREILLAGADIDDVR